MSKLIAGYIEKFIDIETYSMSKVRLGIEIMLINISKLTILFITASIFRAFVPTLIVLISFGVIRKTGGGIHAKTSLRCTVFSVLGLVGGAIIGLRLTMDKWVVILLIVIFNILIYKYAPRDTEKNPIKDKDKRIRLRNITLRNMNILIIVALFLSDDIRTLIIMGIFLAIVTIIPIQNKFKSNIKGGI